MIYQVGRYTFPNKEYLEKLIKSNLLKEHDLSPQAREDHEEKVVYNKDGVKIKLTNQERWEYNKQLLNKPRIIKRLKAE